MKVFYSNIEEYGPRNRDTGQLLDRNGETVLTAKEDTLKRFSEYFDQLLNVLETVDHEALSCVTDRPPDESLDDMPGFDELLDAIVEMKENRTFEECGIPAKV